MSEPDTTVEAGYRDRGARHDAARAGAAKLSRVLSYARLGVFLASAGCLLSLLPGPVSHATLRAVLGGTGLATFFALVAWHSRVEAREQWFAALAAVNADAAARVRRDWGALPAGDVAGPGATHPYADDLDLFGRASLYQLLGWAGTEAGRATLAGWLATPATPDEVRARQQAVEELAPLEQQREVLAARGRLAGTAREALDGLFAWADAGPWFTRSRWAARGVELLTALIVGLVAAQAAGFVDCPLWVWLWPLGTSAALMAIFGKRVAQTFTRVFSRFGLVRQHATLFAELADWPCASPRLTRLQEDLRASGTAAATEMERLARIEQMADLRRVALLHPIIALFTLWDFHTLAALERWQRRAGPQLRRWYAALGQLDALAAMASLRHDNPTWACPDIDPAADRLEAEGLGHPLIPAGRRVVNDVRVGPPGTFLMVTGSNMSGKSTLLRAVGVNVVLAQAGAPVCARNFRMPPLGLCTSMRVQDSLEAGVSYFMAALQRLKLVVDCAGAAGGREPRLLYLLDEVLQGTNTAERQVAVRRVLRHLLDLPTLGVVTTHDLELADCAELATASQAVHFAEGIEEGANGVRLVFDYHLKPGIATSRNALKLLRSVGLDS